MENKIKIRRIEGFPCEYWIAADEDSNEKLKDLFDEYQYFGVIQISDNVENCESFYGGRYFWVCFPEDIITEIDCLLRDFKESLLWDTGEILRINLV